MNNKKEKYLKAYHDLVDRTLKPFKESMTKEEFEQFRYEHTIDDLLNDYEYTFEEEVGYWLEIGKNAYNEYICNLGYKPNVANELKKFCK